MPSRSASAALSRYRAGSEDRTSWTAGSRAPVRYCAAAAEPSASRWVLSRSVLRAASSRREPSFFSALSAFSLAPLYFSVAFSASW